ncbi:hypothetical protein [Arthrobacter sp. OAP107]|uniref:hypothetical protein n=1 Tax=Arthrobacter sp. OAP107 TaxID=3156445 RepID=UPI00339AEDC3
MSVAPLAYRPAGAAPDAFMALLRRSLHGRFGGRDIVAAQLLRRAADPVSGTGP